MLLENSSLIKCSFENWYSKFEKISIPSRYIEIPKDIVEYFQDEIIVLPKECYPDDTNDEESDESDVLQPPEFPEFSASITSTIARLSGAAFIKTNWHCPKDAFWITAGQTLKVKDITDVYQLLKASSIVKKDLDCPIVKKYFIVLKEWREIHPGTEFRCFVKNRSLIAISPRDWPQYHKHILTQKLDIVSDIVSLFKEKIKHEFPLENFVFDVVRDSKDKVYLIDFSPFDEQYTECLAFNWEQLNGEVADSENIDDPEFRFLTSDCGIQPNKRNNYGIPQDIINMFSESEISSSNCLTDLLQNRVE